MFKNHKNKNLDKFIRLKEKEEKAVDMLHAW